MRRKTSDAPTRIYTFGCKPPQVSDEVFEYYEDQLWYSHRYANTLIELKNEQRETMRATRRAQPKAAPLFAEIDQLNAEIDKIYAEIRAIKDGTPVLEARPKWEPLGKVVKSLKKKLIKKYSEVSKLTASNPAVKAADKEAYETYWARLKEARAATLTYWGTYTAREKAAKERFKAGLGPIKFKRYERNGLLTMQLQGGLSVAEMFSGQDLRVQIDPIPDEVWSRGRNQRRKGCRTHVRMRVGSRNAKGEIARGHTPIWIELPLLLHRQLPEDGVVKWAHVKRERHGHKFKYELLLVIEAQSFKPAVSPAPAGKGTIGVDLGWRYQDDKAIRVAYWADSFGQHGAVDLDAYMIGGFDVVRGLKKSRSERQVKIQSDLDAFFRGARKLPDALKEASAHLRLWGAPKRFYKLLNVWRENRIKGDEDFFAALEAWDQKDRHLDDWQANQARRNKNRRADQYRKLTHLWASTYAHVVFEDVDLTRLARGPKTESGNPSTGRTARDAMKRAAPGHLRLLAKEMCDKFGREFVKVPAAFTSRDCFFCGHSEPWEDRSEEVHRCAGCGRAYDRDHNAALNILRTSERVPPETLQMLADGKLPKLQPKPKDFSRRRPDKYIPPFERSQPQPKVLAKRRGTPTAPTIPAQGGTP